MMEDSSIETRSVGGFSTADYVVFALPLCVNAVIGLYYAVKDRRDKKENTQEYLLGGRNQSVITVALSLGVTYISSATMIGLPAEIYYHDTMIMYMALAFVLATTISAWLFIPFFYRLGYTSIFQYLEERFNSKVRALAACLSIGQTLLYMAFLLYGPALALSAVTSLSFEGCMIGMGVVVTLYTSLGGMKTVLWTDTFQAIIMLVGLLTVVIQGFKVMGGWTKVWDMAGERGRVVFDDFSFEPNVRHSFFTVVIGAAFQWMALIGVNQAQVQRSISTSSVSRARIAVLVSTLVLISLLVLSCLNGVILFAFYADCDPVKFGVIGKIDQLMPLFMLDVLGHLKGFPGFFVSSIFAGSLSSLSSGMNAIAAIVLEECRHAFNLKLPEKRAVLLTKAIVISCGAVSVGSAFFVSQLGPILQAAPSVLGVSNGPLFGVFVLGMFFPWANSIGAFAGFLISFAFLGWIAIGAFVNKIRTTIPNPTITLGCNWPNGTELPVSNTSQNTSPLEYEGIDIVYTLSYLNYTMVGMVVMVVSGLIVSFLTGYTRPSRLNPKYVMSMFYFLDPPVKPEKDLDRQGKKRKTNKKRGHKNGDATATIKYSEGQISYSALTSVPVQIESTNII